MIRIQGEQNQSQDPKLKAPAVGSPAARAAVGARPADDVPSLPAYLAPIHARLAALESGLRQALETIAMLERERNAVTSALPAATDSGNGNAGGNAAKLTPAEKQRAYRERQKAKLRDE